MAFPDLDPIDTLYNSRTVGIQRTRNMGEELLRMTQQQYAAMIDDILADEIAGDITPRRAQALRESLGRSLRRFRGGFSGELDSRLRSFMNEVAQSHDEAAQVVASQLGEGVTARQQFGQIDDLVMRQMMARRQRGLSASFKTIAERSLQGSVEEIDTFLTSSVARGKSAGRFKQELATLLAGDDESLRAAIQARRRGSLLDIDEVGDEVRARLPEARQLLNRSRTIAVTETNTAQWEADRFASMESDVVGKLKWRLSGRHAGLKSSPDICDVLAQHDAHGFGPGVYTPGTIPVRPHPNCACIQVKEVKDAENWGDGSPAEPTTPGSVRVTDVRDIFEDEGADPTFNRAVGIKEKMDSLFEDSIESFQSFEQAQRVAQTASAAGEGDDLPLDFNEDVRRMDTREEMRAFADEQQGGTWARLDDDTKEGLDGYKLGSGRLNRDLRKLWDTTDSDFTSVDDIRDPDRIRALRRASLEADPVDESFVTFHGGNIPDEMIDAIKQNGKGYTWTNPQTMSTTPDTDLAKGFARTSKQNPVLFEINVQEGRRGLFFEGNLPDDELTFMNEAEFAIPDGARFVVNEVVDEGSRTRIRVTYFDDVD